MKTWQQITNGALRHIVTTVGGFMIHGGMVANDKVGLASGVIVAAIGVAQSFLSKLKGDVQLLEGKVAEFTALAPEIGRTLSIALLACLAFSFAGCIGSPVPSTQFSGSIGGQPFEFNGRKQTTVKGLNLTLNTGTGTNFSLSIAELSSKNDPQVISKSYAGQAAVEKVRWEGMNNFASKFAEGAGKGVNPLP